MSVCVCVRERERLHSVIRAESRKRCRPQVKGEDLGLVIPTLPLTIKGMGRI